MDGRSSPGLGQWLTVSILLAATIFLLYKLYQFAGSLNYFPTGLTIAGVNVEGFSPQEASEILSNRYIDAPVVVYYEEQPLELNPNDAEFTLDLEVMLSEADYQRDQQDFWSGFWGFLWGRAVEVDPIELYATHNREALVNELSRIADIMYDPAQPPQPVPGTLSFQRGSSGARLDIDGSLADVEAALYRPSQREARLVIEPVEPERPNINLLSRLLVNHLQDFEQRTGGVASVFIMDLQTGEEVSINGDIAISGMDIMKIPIVLDTYRALERPTLTQKQLISETLVIGLEHTSANALLTLIAGQNEPYLGVQSVTESMQRLGLQNTFMIAPYEETVRAGQRTPATPANQKEGVSTNPDPYMQTTSEDMGTLLSMIYYCAQGNGGALQAIYVEQITPAECQEILTYMRLNRIGSLIEQGVPQTVPVAHRHGWVSDTHGDAGIVYTPAGDYVIVQFLYKPDWLEWELSAPLLAEISQATYNFFNFDDPFLTDVRTN